MSENHQPSAPVKLKETSGIKAVLKMPKDKLLAHLQSECKEEHKFIQMSNKGKVLPRDQPLFKPSNISKSFLALNDIKPLKKVT